MSFLSVSLPSPPPSPPPFPPPSPPSPPLFSLSQALVVLEYLIKSGSDRVAVQCKENMFSIQTLKDFQYVDKDGKDQGSSSEK